VHRSITRAEINGSSLICNVGSESFASRRASRDFRKALIIATILPAEVNLRNHESCGREGRRVGRCPILDRAIDGDGPLEIIDLVTSPEKEKRIGRNFRKIFDDDTRAVGGNISIEQVAADVRLRSA
jgi:hypothetical protein